LTKVNDSEYTRGSVVDRLQKTHKHIEAIMQKAKPTPAVKFDTGAVIATIADLMVSVAKTPALVQVEVNKLRKAKLTIGTIKQNCALALRFQTAFDAAGVKPTTRDNYLAAVRQAVNQGIPFTDFNASRAKAKAMGKTTKASKPASNAPAAPATLATPAAPATPAGQTVSAPKTLVNQPSDAVEAVAVALSNVRASCTADTWKAVLVLHPALGAFLEKVQGVWVEGKAAVIPAAPAKKKAAK